MEHLPISNIKDQPAHLIKPRRHAEEKGDALRIEGLGKEAHPLKELQALQKDVRCQV